MQKKDEFICGVPAERLTLPVYRMALIIACKNYSLHVKEDGVTRTFEDIDQAYEDAELAF